ncbi:MAG: pyridoxal-phosphate dependent enzyme, partial [Bacteroidota bacterium]|nr:pyridoxal-phosphate dependent enzyme [Bacteroidota bacterium]
NVLDGNEVMRMCKATNCTGYTVPDQLIYQCQEDLAKDEGIFCEPAGAVALAGLKLALENREINKNDHIVCIVTGHGFKDPVSAGKIAASTADHYFMESNVCFSYINSQINTIL